MYVIKPIYRTDEISDLESTRRATARSELNLFFTFTSSCCDKLLLSPMSFLLRGMGRDLGAFDSISFVDRRLEIADRRSQLLQNIRGQKSETRGQKSEVRSQKSERGTQRSKPQTKLATTSGLETPASRKETGPTCGPENDLELGIGLLKTPSPPHRETRCLRRHRRSIEKRT